MNTYPWTKRIKTTFALALILLTTLLGAVACGGNEEATSGGETSAASAQTGGPIKFVYFYKADCAPCQEMEPIIQGLENDFKDKLVVERYDAASDEGSKLMSDYALADTPSYAMIGTDGTKLWSLTGQIHKDMLRQQVQLRVSQ
jgi:thiol-disulfide isomerase/thioredoxin